MNLSDLSIDVMRIIDKIDKVGKEAVVGELTTLGITQKASDRIINFISIDGSTDEKISALKELAIDN